MAGADADNAEVVSSDEMHGIFVTEATAHVLQMIFVIVFFFRIFCNDAAFFSRLQGAYELHQ